MIPETETASPAAGINGKDGRDATITCASDTTIKSSASNGGQGHVRGGRTGRGNHQEYGGRGVRFNRPTYKYSIRNSKV